MDVEVVSRAGWWPGDRGRAGMDRGAAPHRGPGGRFLGAKGD